MSQDTTRWYLPQDARSAVDAVENTKTIIRFICDTISQEGFKPDYRYSLSIEGTTGLYQILSFVEDVLDNSIDKIHGGLKHAN